MPLSPNLHDMVRVSIHGIHPDLDAVLYRNTGQTTIGGGKITPSYADGVPVTVQRQSIGSTELRHLGQLGSEQNIRKFYLRCPGDPESRPSGISRPLARGGDLLRVATDETWWLIDGLLEDFSASGWVCVRATRQLTGPNDK